MNEIHEEQDQAPPFIGGSSGDPNPYRTDPSTRPQFSPPEEITRGLDGDLLDSLLKTRMREGLNLGELRGEAEARREFERVFDEGFSRGLEARQRQVEASVHALYREISQAFDEQLGELHEVVVLSLANARGNRQLARLSTAQRHVSEVRQSISTLGDRIAERLGV